MIALFLSLSGLAADVDRYPLAAPVVLPPEGVARIDVPLGLRTPGDPDDGSDLLLVDGTGAVVPVARLTTRWRPEHVDPGSTFVVTPTDEPDVFEIEVRNRPVDALDVTLPSVPAVATVRVEHQRDGGWVPVSEPTRVYRIENGQETVVPLAQAVTGGLRVRIEWETAPPPFAGGVALSGLRHPEPYVPEDRVVVPVAGWRLQENGYARYEVALPSAWPARKLHLHPVEDLFDRQAGAIDPPEPETPGESPWWEPTPSGWETIQRLRVGGADLERVSIAATSPSDRVVFLVASDDRPPLTIPEIEVEVPGVHLLVQDAGPGPHTLYGGAPIGTSPSYDIGLAAPELARLPAPVVAPGEVAANPAYVAPEVRADLVGPSTPLPLGKYRWSHEVTGPAGLVRVPLPAEVLADGRSDLADLRLVSADGRQIPYVLRRRGIDLDLGTLPFTRTERGTQSILEVPLPVKGVPLATVAIGTSAPVFQRRVTLARPDGPRLETLRAYDWVGEDRPGRLVLDVGEQVVGDTLAVTIDNGDDPPLPIDAIAVAWPAWELWAGLPPEGARLIYGNPSAHRPDYDLGLLREQIGRRAVAVATVGPRTALARPAPSLVDRALTAFGMGVLGVGLLVLTIRLLRAVPEAKPEGDAKPEEPAGA